jgi:signal transduction histidine kinase
MRTALHTLAVILAVAGGAGAGAPELFERAVLPSSLELPTCACVVPLGERDQLVVGLDNGRVVSFHETGGRIIPRSVWLPGGRAVDDVVPCCTGRSAGASECTLLALSGGELFSIPFGRMELAGSVRLPTASGRYRLAKAARVSKGGVDVYGARRSDHVIVYDDDSVMSVIVEPPAYLPRVEPHIDGEPGLVVTTLSDRVVVVHGESVTEFDANGVRPSIVESAELMREPTRMALGADAREGRTLEFRVSHPDSIWVSRTVTVPDDVTVVAPVGDALMAAGGTAPLTPSHDVGWLALVDTLGAIVATSDHASPVTDIVRVGDHIAVQGDGRNLSVYDLSLKPLWDHDSPVTDAMLLSGNFSGDAAPGLAVVGTRTYRVSSADVDSIRKYLDLPGFARGATRTNGGVEIRRSFITFYVSNAGLLQEMLTDGIRAAADAFEAGEHDLAVERAMEARAAGAVLGRRQALAALSSRMKQYVSFSGRRRSLLLTALVLAALGMWAGVECERKTSSFVATVVAATLLFAAGFWSWKLLGRTGANPLLLAGGALTSFFVVRSRLIAKTDARCVSGAAIEDLIRTLMEFLHGAGEGVPSDGVVDAARKSVTKVAYLAQEMVESIDDRERYELLRERFRSRARDFMDTTHPRVLVLLSHAEEACFVVHEVGLMAAAANRMRAAITTVLHEPAPEAPILRQQLESLREARDRLASAADKAWAIVQTNPGCSLTKSLERILREKSAELEEAGVRVEQTDGVPPEQDALALWSFRFRFVLENLVTNAVRAMRDSRERKLTVTTETDGAMCTIRVTDTGCGMTEQKAADVFRSKPEERDGGSGLPSSRALLQERGGDLVVERTAVGEGTTFTLTIPHWRPNRGES